MSLVYATELSLLNRTDGRPATMESVTSQVAEWAGVDPLIEGVQSGRRGLVYIEILNSPTTRIWHLKLAHGDQQDTSLQWSVSVTVLSDNTTAMATRLELARLDGSVLAVRTTPRPPGCISKVIDSTDICAVDGDRPLSPNVWVVMPEDAHALATLILHPDRKLPIFAFTPRDEDPIDGGVLSGELPGLAHIVLVQVATSWELQELIPRGFGVYGGAARIWWPHIALDAEERQKWTHKLWSGDIPASRISAECTDLIVTAGLSAAMIENRVASLRHQHRSADILRLRAELETAVRTQEQKKLQANLSEFEALVRSYESEARDAKNRASQAESDLRFWKGEAARLRTQQVGHTDVDEADLLRKEIESEVNRRGIVNGARTRPFILGPQFAATGQQHGGRYRRRIVQVCADVVLNAPDLHRRIDDHILRTCEGGSNPAVRRMDGAVAHRCAIEHNSPAARRVHYWVLADGSVEFASVNVHDDLNIPGL